MTPTPPTSFVMSPTLRFEYHESDVPPLPDCFLETAATSVAGTYCWM